MANRPPPSFTQYASVIASILRIIENINSLAQYFNLTQIATQNGINFIPVSPKTVANSFKLVYYSNKPGVVSTIQYNPFAVVTETSRIATTIPQSIVETLGQQYNLTPSLLKSILSYVKLATILPTVIENKNPAVVSQQQTIYDTNPDVVPSF